MGQKGTGCLLYTSGPFCDAQVLVIHDLLGLFERFIPKFVKQYAQIGHEIVKALTEFDKEVKTGYFPDVYKRQPMAEAHAIGLESAGVKMLKQVDVPTDAIMFGPLVLKALAQKPDGIMLTCNSEKAAKIIVELEKKGWKDKSKILVFSSADDTALYTTGGASLEAVSYTHLCQNQNCF